MTSEPAGYCLQLALISVMRVPMQRLAFELQTDTPNRLREQLAHSLRVALVGAPGTGRSTAVQEAVNGDPVLRLSLGNHPARTALAMRQAAATVGGSELLRTFVDRGPEAALDQLDARVGDGLVLIDDADALLVHTPKMDQWTDDVPGMVAPIDALWVDWLRDRRGPSVLVGHRCALDGFAIVEHESRVRSGEGQPVTLRGSEGIQAWSKLTEKLADRLDRFYFARAVAPTMSSDVFEDLVANADLSEILLVFGRMFRAGGGHRSRALDVIYTLDGASESVVRHALDSLAGGDDDFDPPSESSPDLLTELRRDHLVTVSGADNGRDGVVRPIAALVESRSVIGLSDARCGALARGLLRRVNDPGTLEPDAAAVVFAAHDLAVRSQQVELAVQTARLHVHGLIELAKSLSVDHADFLGAWRLYDRTEALVPALSETSHARVRSYVLNYRAYNGRRARQLDAAGALADVTEAVSLWPENALWHRQKLALLLALGRETDAFSALREAESCVAPHPQRARHLRVYPARIALQAGSIRLAIELLDLASPQWVEDWAARESVTSILQQCAAGVAVVSMASSTSRIQFLSSRRCSLVRVPGEGRSSWTARLDGLNVSRTERDPIRALDALVDGLAEEVKRLVGQPTAWLGDTDALRKGVLLGSIDVLNSDIGLAFATDRWFVGRIEGNELRVMDARVGAAIEIGAGVVPPGASTIGMWFGLAPVDRAGFPSGPVKELRPAGSGRTADELRMEMERLRNAAS